jgi:hypothetical protein
MGAAPFVCGNRRTRLETLMTPLDRHGPRGPRGLIVRAVMAIAWALAVFGCSQVPLPAAPKTSPPESTPPSSPTSPTSPSSPVTLSIRLERIAEGSSVVSFGLPLSPGVASDPSQIRVAIGTTAVSASITPLLYDHDRNGDRTSLRAVRVQFPASLMPGPTLTIDVTPGEAGPSPAATVTPFAALSVDSPETVSVADRTIVHDGNTYRLQELNPRQITLFAGREPAVIAHFPTGYLAHSGILGPQVTAAEVSADADRAGLTFLSAALTPFVRSALYEESYALNPAQESVVDPVYDYEGWLYDRCTTLLTAYSHVGDATMLRHALRACSYYSSKITLEGPDRGIFSGKPYRDPKYSHARGLYAYYALTGDERALASLVAIADMWDTEEEFVVPYRAGGIISAEKLWTERLLGTSMEGLYYGFLATDNKKYLTAFGQVLDTAYRHIATASQAELVAINKDPNTPPFPLQNCWVHNAAQAAEGNTDRPWCSGWMNELVIDSLLAYQAQTGDPRVDEIFVRLARFLRDVGSSYFQNNPLDDHFLEPAVCYDASQAESTRILVPLYGSGLLASGARVNRGEWSDFEHCTDATALTAVALRALVRRGTFDQGGPVGPFPSEGAALLQMHQEFAFCAQRTFTTWDRPNRDPATWTSAALAPGASNPASFILANRIGFPSHPSSPQRKLSWWFNTSLLQYSLLREAGIQVPALRPGAIQPRGTPCPPR